MCAHACMRICVRVGVKQANLVLITLYLFHQCCALAYFHSYKFTTLPSVVIDDPLILAHLWRLRARKEVGERQRLHFTAYDVWQNFPCPQNYLCVLSWYAKKVRNVTLLSFIQMRKALYQKTVNKFRSRACHLEISRMFWVLHLRKQLRLFM